MKTAIRFFTRSKKGNTLKLAKAVSEAIGAEAVDVSVDLAESVDKLFLINAMYAADVDAEVKNFLARNRDNIGEIVNMNTSASGASTWKAVKRAADQLGIALSGKEFHCRGSWIFINKGLPSADDLNRAKGFASSVLEE
jgi:flavodoxin